MSKPWIPEIMYEEASEGTSSSIPFVMVPKGQTMPHLLYIFESRETEELEPNMEGEPVPVFEWDLHQYADMVVLKNSLDHFTYDKVRRALGLESLDSAVEKGQKITDKIKNNLDK